LLVKAVVIVIADSALLSAVAVLTATEDARVPPLTPFESAVAIKVDCEVSLLVKAVVIVIADSALLSATVPCEPALTPLLSAVAAAPPALPAFVDALSALLSAVVVFTATEDARVDALSPLLSATVP
jgi:hypothetical protein